MWELAPLHKTMENQMQFKNQQLTVITNNDGNIELIKVASWPFDHYHVPLLGKIITKDSLRFEIAVRMHLSQGDRLLAKQLSENIFAEKPINTQKHHPNLL